MGNPVDGKKYYELAIEAANRQDNQILKITARLYLARERVLQNEPDAFKEFRKAHDEAKKFPNTTLPAISECLAKQVVDTEIRKGTKEAKRLINVQDVKLNFVKDVKASNKSLGPPSN